MAAELWPCPSACRALHCSSSRDRRAGTALETAKEARLKKSEGFIYEEVPINLHEPVQSDDKKVLQLIGEQGKYLLQGQGRG